MPVDNPLSARVLEAYGGEGRWSGAARVEAIVSLRGLLLTVKRVPPLERMHVSVDVHRPRARLSPREWEGETGILDGGDVRIETVDRRLVATRRDARQAFRGLRRALRWDRLDLVYFAGAALWTDLAFPGLLLRDDVGWRQLSPVLLEGSFPPSLPTHSPVQRFHVAPTGLLVQHDFTAEVLGRWAHAAQAVVAHDAWMGVPYPSLRRATLRTASGRVLSRPTLLELQVHRWRLVPPSDRTREG